MSKPKPATPPAETPKKRRTHGYVPTEESRSMVKAMVGVGIGQRDICTVLDISCPTLHRHYRRELDTAYIDVVRAVRRKLLAQALAGDTQCLIHVNKVLGWNDRLVVVDGGSEVDVTQLSDEELQERIARLQRSPAVRTPNRGVGSLH